MEHMEHAKQCWAICAHCMCVHYFLPAENSRTAYVMCKGDKRVPGIPPLHIQKIPTLVLKRNG